MKTPVKIAVIAMLVNAIFNIILINHFKHAGLALATSIAALTHSIILIQVLAKRGDIILDKKFYQDLVKIIGSSLIMLGLLLVYNYYLDLDFWLYSAKLNKIFWLAIILLTSCVLYFISLLSVRFKLLWAHSAA